MTKLKNKKKLIKEN